LLRNSTYFLGAKRTQYITFLRDAVVASRCVKSYISVALMTLEQAADYLRKQSRRLQQAASGESLRQAVEEPRTSRAIAKPPEIREKRDTIDVDVVHTD